jgi:hypothetical protein
VDEILQNNINDFKLNIDFEKYRKILINDYNFNSFEKPIEELKKKLATPTQNSLF